MRLNVLLRWPSGIGIGRAERGWSEAAGAAIGGRWGPACAATNSSMVTSPSCQRTEAAVLPNRNRAASSALASKNGKILWMARFSASYAARSSKRRIGKNT